MTQSENRIPELAAAAASEKKARDIVIMDMREISTVTDAFVLATGGTSKQVQAIADNIEEKLQEAGHTPIGREGYREAKWVLIDYGSCLVHIFVEEDRTFYDLEHLWSEAPKTQYEDGANATTRF